MRPDTDRRIRLRPLLGWTLALLLAGVWLAWWQGDALCAWLCAPESAKSESAPPEVADAGGGPAPEAGAGPSEREIREARWERLMGSAPLWPADLNSPASCEEVEQSLIAVCRELDSRAYVSERLRGGGTCALIRQLSEELAGRPPVVSSELKSLASILDNVFHLFRTLGRNQAGLMQRIVREEQELAEPVSLAVYRWLISRERCAVEAGTEIDADSLYAYAGFLIQTIGGQAYLRRRSPETESLASFYALAIVDAAIERGHNPEGIDPRSTLDRCRKLIARQPLLFRDRYLEALDEMARRWEGRG